jgi:Transport protein Trs120 or TRAPPC9, TRAPP II complex subunit
MESNLSPAEEQTQRELFWYREELLRCIHAHWQEVGYPLRFSLKLALMHKSSRLGERGLGIYR